MPHPPALGIPKISDLYPTSFEYSPSASMIMASPHGPPGARSVMIITCQRRHLQLVAGYDIVGYVMTTNVTEFGTVKDVGMWQRQEAFLKAFSRRGTILRASKDVGITRQCAQRWWSDDVYGFRERLAGATADHSDRLEEKLFEQTLETEKPNPILLIFALKGAKREKYGDSVVVHNDRAGELLEAVRGLSASPAVVEGEVVSAEEEVRQAIARPTRATDH